MTLLALLRSLFLVIRTILTAALIAGALWLLHTCITPEKPPYSAEQREAVARLAAEVLLWVQGLPLAPGRTSFGNFENDRFAFVAYPVRDALWRTGRCDLVDRGLLERVRQRADWTIPVRPSGAELLAHARQQQAVFAIGGRVIELAHLPEGTRLRAELEIWDVAAGRCSHRREFVVRTTGLGTISSEFAPSFLSLRSGLLIWLAIVLLLPLALLPWAQALLVYGSNVTIFLTLVALVAVDTAAGFLLFAYRADGTPGMFLLLAVFAIGIAVNYKALAVLKQRHT